MTSNSAYNLTDISQPVTTQPVAVQMPADIDLDNLNQLLNNQQVPVRPA